MRTDLPPLELMTVADLANRSGSAIRVLTAHRIDFCCGGGRPLAEACRRAGTNPQVVLAEVAADEAQTMPDGRDWTTEPTNALVDYILTHHHAFLDRELPRLGELARKVARVHGGPDAPHHAAISAAVEEITLTLVPHMRDEEKNLFPAMLAGEHHNVRPQLWRMFDEHRAVGDLLARIRGLASNYELPGGACGSWRALWSGLETLEAAIHEHVHLENNVLARRFVEGCAA